MKKLLKITKCLNVRLYTYVCVSMFLCMFVCTCVYISTMATQVPAHTHTGKHKYIEVCIYIYVRLYTHLCMCVCTCVYTSMYVCMHIDDGNSSPPITTIEITQTGARSREAVINFAKTQSSINLAI